MEITTIKNFTENIVNKGFQVEEYLCLVNPSKTVVSYGSQNDVDFAYCKEHDIPCYNLKRDGGCIIHFAGNICWAKIESNQKLNFDYENIRFLAKLTAYLREKGINAVQENNDILVDGYKVASGCAINLTPDFVRTFSAVQINVNCDLELIQNVCKKPMTKTPKGLSEYGITTNEMLIFTNNYFKNK